MTMTDAVPQSLLRHRAFVLFWYARIFTAVAFQMMWVAVGWQIYELTGRAFDLGLVGLVQFLPAAMFMLVAGQVADRYDRRRIVQICQAIESLAAAALAAASFTDWVSKDLILAAVFVVGFGRTFEATTMQAFLPTVVPATLFPRAVAASSSAQQVATIAGPAVGGLLYAVSPTSVYAICAVLFLCAALQIGFIKGGRLANGARPPVTWQVFFAGVAFIRRNPIVLGAILLDLFAVLLGGATALLPIFAKDVFDVGPSGLGLLRAAPALGAILIMVALARATFTRHVGRIMFAAVACFGAATIVFALSHSFALSVAALAALGAADAVSVVIRMTLVQLETPDDMRGRVSAVNSLFVGMSNQLGEFRAGMAAALIGAIPAVLIGGIGTLIVVAAGIKLFPALYRIEGFHSLREG
jgi:MFS family permease